MGQHKTNLMLTYHVQIHTKLPCYVIRRAKQSSHGTVLFISHHTQTQHQGSQFRGKPVGYRGNRPYRCGSVGVTDRFFNKTEPTKSPYSVNRSKTSVNRSGFVGFENRYCSGFLNPAQHSRSERIHAPTSISNKHSKGGEGKIPVC
jgi:hypothetical protein